MDPITLGLFETLLFFIILGVTFKALMMMDITKLFQKGAIWQMQITVIFLSISIAYLVTKALMNLIDISFRIFS